MSQFKTWILIATAAFSESLPVSDPQLDPTLSQYRVKFSYESKEEFICHGILVDPFHVVAPARCVRPEISSNLKVGRQGTNENTLEDIKFTRIHPDAKFAVISMKSPLNTPTVQPIPEINQTGEEISWEFCEIEVENRRSSNLRTGNEQVVCGRGLRGRHCLDRVDTWCKNSQACSDGSPVVCSSNGIKTFAGMFTSQPEDGNGYVIDISKYSAWIRDTISPKTEDLGRIATPKISKPMKTAKTTFINLLKSIVSQGQWM